MKNGLNKSQVSALYVTLFGRSAEKAGLDNWVNYSASNLKDVNEVSKTMLDTQAAKNFFAGKLDSSKAFIDHIYATTLNKGAGVDEVGKQGWADLIDQGYDKGLIVAELIKAAVHPQWKLSKDQATKDAHNLFVNKVIMGNIVGELTGFVSSEGNIAENLKPFLKVNSLVTPNSTKAEIKQILLDNANELGLDITRLDEMLNKHTRASIIKEISGLDDDSIQTPEPTPPTNTDDIKQITKEEKDKLISEKDKIADGSLENLKLTIQDLKDFEANDMIRKIKDKGVIKIISDNPLEYQSIKGFLTVEPLRFKLGDKSIDDISVTDHQFKQLIADGMGPILNDFSVDLTDKFQYDPLVEIFYKRVLKDYKDAEKVLTVQEFRDTPLDQLLKIKHDSLSFKDNDKVPLNSNDLDKLNALTGQLKGSAIKKIELKTSELNQIGRTPDEKISLKIANKAIKIVDDGEMNYGVISGFKDQLVDTKISKIKFENIELALWNMKGGLASVKEVVVDNPTYIYQFQTVDKMIEHMSAGRDYIDMFHELRTLDNKDITLPKNLLDKYGSKIKSDVSVINDVGGEFTNGEGKSINLTGNQDKIIFGDNASKLKINGFTEGQDKISFSDGIAEKSFTKLTLDVTGKDFSGANFSEISAYLVGSPIKTNGTSVVVIKDDDSNISQIYRINNDSDSTVTQEEIVLVGTIDANLELNSFVA